MLLNSENDTSSLNGNKEDEIVEMVFVKEDREQENPFEEVVSFSPAQNLKKQKSIEIVKEEDQGTVMLSLHITWTPKQKAHAMEMLAEKSIISVYHYFYQRIPYNTLKSWKKAKTIPRKKGSGRKPTNIELDLKILEWFIDARALKFPINNKTLVTKAKNIRDELVEEEQEQLKINKLKELKFGKNWVDKFKMRHKLKARLVNTFCKKPYNYIEQKLNGFYEAFDLVKNKARLFLNMDECAVYLELSHKQTLTVNGENHVGIISAGKEKQRVTVILTIGYSPYRSNYAVTKIPPIILFKKSKPKNCTRDRPESDLYEDDALKKLAEQKGALLLQSYSGWNDEYFMENYYIPHLRRNISRQTSSLLLMDNFRESP